MSAFYARYRWTINLSLFALAASVGLFMVGTGEQEWQTIGLAFLFVRLCIYAAIAFAFDSIAAPAIRRLTRAKGQETQESNEQFVEWARAGRPRLFTWIALLELTFVGIPFLVRMS